MEVAIPSRTVYVTSESPTPSSLFNDIQRGYARITKSPLALTLLVLGLLSIIAENNGRDGPFEVIKASLEKYLKGTGLPVLFTTLAQLLLGIVKFIVDHKKTIFLFMLIAIIPLTYKETSVTFTTIALIIYVIVTSHSQLTSVLLIQLVFIYYSISEFMWRIVDIIIILYLMFGSENINLMLSKDESKSYSNGTIS